MAESYIISIDQSTQGTKALLFDQDGMLFQRKISRISRSSMKKDGFLMIRKNLPDTVQV